MTRNDRALVSASSHHPARLAAACRALAIGGVVAALAACAEHADPAAPKHPAVESALSPAEAENAVAVDLTSDASDRIPKDHGPSRGDAAELDAMRLEIDDARASLR